MNEITQLKKLMESITTLTESDYTLYHNTLTSAIQEVDRLLARKGYAMDPDHAADIIGFGPAKPQVGKTNKYAVKLRQGDKDGPLTKKYVQIQVYNRGIKGNTYELNTYIG